TTGSSDGCCSPPVRFLGSVQSSSEYSLMIESVCHSLVSFSGSNSGRGVESVTFVSSLEPSPSVPASAASPDASDDSSVDSYDPASSAALQERATSPPPQGSSCPCPSAHESSPVRSSMRLRSSSVSPSSDSSPLSPLSSCSFWICSCE